MILLPPRSTRTDTLFPYSTLFRSSAGRAFATVSPLPSHFAISPYSDTCLFFRNWPHRSEEHTSELQALMRNSYAAFCLKKQKELDPDRAHQPRLDYRV